MASNVENVLNWCESNGAGSSACGYGGVQSTSCWKMSLRNFSFSRNTSNCEYGYVKCDVYEQTDWTNLGWASTSGNYRLSSVAASNSHGQGAHVDHWGSKGVKCHPSVTYSATLSNVTVGVTAIDNQLWYGYIWGFTPGSYDYQYLNTATYNMADDMRITAPSGLTVSFPSAADGTVSASISYWGMSSAATNMTGTPTTYPNATYWNWALDLLDQYGNTLAHKCSNTGETKSKSWTGNSFYTASALEGTAAATSSKYTMQANAAYKLKVVVNNSFNQSVAQESNLMYSLPPTPTLTIDSCIYVPTTKDATLTFSWSKAADAGALTETIKYDVYDANGTYYKSGVVLATVTDGTAQTGTITVTGLPSGEQYTVKVTLSTTAGTTSATDSTYAPVANAAFLGFDWDELRRTCTIRAEAPGAANCRIQAGYQANVYDIGDKLTPGQIGTLVVKDLDHGDGEILYLQAIPEASNGYQYENEIAKISVPIPNPILGLRIPECESEAEPEYIVDILEKKPDCSLTQRWQNGDRIVVKDKCELKLPFCRCVTIVDREMSASVPAASRYVVARFEWYGGWTKEDIDLSPTSMNPEWIDKNTLKWYPGAGHNALIFNDASGKITDTLGHIWNTGATHIRNAGGTLRAILPGDVVVGQTGCLSDDDLGEDPCSSKTFANLKTALKNGTAKECFPVGTEIPDTWNGNSNAMVVAHYLDSTNNSAYSGAEGVILIRKYVEPTEVDYDTSTAIYSDASIRSYLNTTYLSGCTNDLKNVMSSITICSIVPGPYGSAPAYTTGKLFLMSTEEMGGIPNATYGKYFEIWEERGLTSLGGSASPARILTDRDGNIAKAWTRTSQYSRTFGYTVASVSKTGGLVASLLSEGPFGVLPACFISKD